jgi:hypothetical protein
MANPILKVSCSRSFIINQLVVVFRLLFVNNTPQLIPIKQKKRIHQKGRKATTE